MMNPLAIERHSARRSCVGSSNFRLELVTLAGRESLMRGCYD